MRSLCIHLYTHEEAGIKWHFKLYTFTHLKHPCILPPPRTTHLLIQHCEIISYCTEAFMYPPDTTWACRKALSLTRLYPFHVSVQNNQQFIELGKCISFYSSGAFLYPFTTKRNKTYSSIELEQGYLLIIIWVILVSILRHKKE